MALHFYLLLLVTSILADTYKDSPLNGPELQSVHGAAREAKGVGDSIHGLNQAVSALPNGSGSALIFAFPVVVFTCVALILH
ncbi:hypothetical protein TSMEX_004919 [Taenia solium]|eukprot:TsM_000235800 transcript=TsM_000235800 gene=TsM_000235800